MLQSFVYHNLRTVYQSRLADVQNMCAERRVELLKAVAALESEMSFARLHCPNRCTRIGEQIAEMSDEIKTLDANKPLSDFQSACGPFLIQMDQQAMDLIDVERFYGTMGVLFRPNHFVNASTHKQPAPARERKKEVESVPLVLVPPMMEMTAMNLHVCPECDVARVYDEYEAYAICPRCGNAVPFQRESHESEDTMQYTIQFEYDRANHLREYLNQIIKAEENVSSIPPSVIRGIKRQILKERITNRAMITPRRIKDWLKRDLKMSKYSEKVYSILFAVCKIRPPKIPKALEEKFYEMFEQVQKPFARHVPVGRVHFFNYGYLVRKFSELLGQRHLLPVFPILKGTDRVHFQDDIWKKCCVDLGWQFIPSI